MKHIKITLSVLTILSCGTLANANDRCDQEIGNVFGERDRAWQKYPDFKAEVKGQMEGLEFLAKNCDAELKANDISKKTIENVRTYFNKQINATEAQWEKEYKGI